MPLAMRVKAQSPTEAKIGLLIFSQAQRTVWESEGVVHSAVVNRQDPTWGPSTIAEGEHPPIERGQGHALDLIARDIE